MIVLEEKFIILIVGGVAIFSILVIFIILFISLYQKRYYRHLKGKQILQSSFQKEVLKTQLETQEHTFQQIAKELHDNVGQLLSTTKMLLGITERKMEQVPDTLVTAHATLGKAIFELRSLSKSLDKEWLEQFNLIDNLQAEITRINAGDSLKVSCTCSGTISLKSDEQIIFFRIIQEALQNSIKHAGASLLTLSIDADKKNITVTIADNGNGFDENASHTGMGLTNMRYRSMLLGGNIHWQSSLNSGTTVTIHLPVKFELP